MGHLVKERMGRGKPMRWSANGANLLLQVRCASSITAKIPAHSMDRGNSWTRPRAVGRLRDVPACAVLWPGTPRCVTRLDTFGSFTSTK